MAYIISETPWTGLTFQIWDDGDITYRDDANDDADSPKAVDVYRWLKEHLPEAKADDAETAKQARWNAVYGAMVAQMAMRAMDDSAEFDENGGAMLRIPAETMRKITALARQIADAAIAVDP